MMDPISRRRGPIEIYFDILTSCLEPKLMTGILRWANIQYGSFQNYFNPLLKAGYLEKEIYKKRFVYRTSPSGKELMHDMIIVARKLDMEGFEIPRIYNYITKEV